MCWWMINKKDEAKQHYDKHTDPAAFRRKEKQDLLITTGGRDFGKRLAETWNLHVSDGGQERRRNRRWSDGKSNAAPSACWEGSCWWQQLSGAAGVLVRKHFETVDWLEWACRRLARCQPVPQLISRAAETSQTAVEHFNFSLKSAVWTPACDSGDLEPAVAARTLMPRRGPEASTALVLLTRVSTS